MRRPLVLASLAVLLIIGLTVVLLSQAERDEPPATQPPLSPLVAPTPSPAPAPAPPPIEQAAVVVDSGTPPALRDVRFTLRKQGKTVVGERVELERERRVVSGTLNVMGELVLPLEDGEWRVRSPRHVRPSRVTISAGVEHLDLEQLDFLVSGRVIDAQQQPVHGVVLHGRSGTGTDLEGCFVIDFDSEEAVTLVVESGLERSLPKRIRPPAKDLVFVVEKRITFTVSTNALATVVVRHRGGFERCNTTPCTVQVLEGEVIATAVGPRGGLMQTARKSGQVKDTTTWELTLGPTKPLKGRLLNARGEPIPGATVRLEGVALTSDEFLDVGGNPKVLGSKRVAVTNQRGEFSMTWPDANELFFAVSTEAPIALDRRVYVVPGDLPLTLTTVP